LFRRDPGSLDVNHALCKVQSAIVYGAAPALSAAAFSVVARLWFLTFTVDKSRSLLLPNAKWFTVVLVALPWAVWLGVSVVSGITSGDNVRRFPQYCASDKQTPSIVSGVVTAVLLIVASCFQAWTLFIVWGRYRRTRRLGKQEIGNIDVALFVRICAFTVLIVIAIVLSIVAIVSAWSQVAPDLLVGGMGMIMFLIFGTQRDVLERWHLRPKQHVSTRTQRSTPANTFTSVHAAARSVPGSSGAPYGTDAWDIERDLAHHGPTNGPTIIVSGRMKGDGKMSSTEDSDTEEIEMGDSKPSAQMEDEEEARHPAEGGISVRTIRVWTYDDPPVERQRQHGHAQVDLSTSRSSLSDSEKAP
ncbi:hypothetical protein FRB90_001095, partial [Tulasnella sp. 427]